MPDNTPYFYLPERDDEYVSDTERLCPAVQEYYHVQDLDDLAQWRSKFYSTCRICDRNIHCFPCIQMQSAHPRFNL